MRSFVVGLAMLGAFTACSSATDSNTSDLVLNGYQAKWDSNELHSYTYDYNSLGALRGINAHVTVVNDSVTSVIDASTGLPPDFPETVPTIDQLFADAHSILSEHFASVHFDFDKKLGYPTLVSASNNTPGGPYIARVSNLQPIP
jgi:hypothetical protein